MYILYGCHQTRSIGPRMVLEEGGMPYEHREVDIRKGAHRTPEYLAINPAGYVPTLVTPEGAMLQETAAIMLYLADRHGLDDLLPPAGSVERGQAYNQLFFQTSDIQPAMKRYFYTHRYSADKTAIDGVKARAREMAVERWGVLDAHLRDHGPYALGDRFSLVDIHMCVWAGFGFDEPGDFLDDFPAVAHCFDLVTARPAIAPITTANFGIGAAEVAKG